MTTAATLTRALVALVFAEVRPDEHALLAALEAVRAALVGDAPSIAHVEAVVGGALPASPCPTLPLLPIAARLALAVARGGGTELALADAYERAEEALAGLYLAEGFGERSARLEASIEIVRACVRHAVDDDDRPRYQPPATTDDARAA